MLVTFVRFAPLFFLSPHSTCSYANDMTMRTSSSPPLLIRTCRHVLLTGSRCQGAAIRGRTYCRHHLLYRTRLHNMARARRRGRLLRLAISDTLMAIASNQHRVRVAMATDRLDADTGRVMLWAFRLSAALLRADMRLQRRPSPQNRAAKSKHFYQVPANPLDIREYIQGDA